MRYNNDFGLERGLMVPENYLLNTVGAHPWVFYRLVMGAVHIKRFFAV